MATTVRRLKAVLDAEDRASPKLVRFGKVLAGVGAAATALGAVALGRVLVGGIASVTRAAAEYEGAATRLGVALINQGRATEEAQRSLLDYARELTDVSNATETQIVDALAAATALGATEEAAKALTAAATDLSVATGVDLDTAFRQVNRTLGGYAGELGEIVPELKELTAEQLRAGEAAGVLNAKFGGAGAAGAGTLIGSLNNLNSAFDQLKVTIGGPFLEVATTVINDFLIPVIRYLEGAARNSDTFRDAIIDAGIALTQFTRAGLEALEFAADWVDIVSRLLSGDPREQLFAFISREGDRNAAAETLSGIADQLDILEESLRRLRESEPRSFADILGLDPDGGGPLVESLNAAGQAQLTLNEAVREYAELGAVALRANTRGVERFGNALRRNVRTFGVQAATTLGDALVGAAVAGELAFDRFLESLLVGLASAIAQALILQAILAAIGGVFGGASIFAGGGVPFIAPGAVPSFLPASFGGGAGVVSAALAPPAAGSIGIGLAISPSTFAEAITAEVRSGNAYLESSALSSARNLR